MVMLVMGNMVLAVEVTQVARLMAAAQTLFAAAVIVAASVAARVDKKKKCCFIFWFFMFMRVGVRNVPSIRHLPHPSQSKRMQASD